MKVYKVELMIVDHDGLGSDDAVRDVLENTRYPNRCIYPHVVGIQSREVEWSDEHPLNHGDTQADAFAALFAGVPQ